MSFCNWLNMNNYSLPNFGLNFGNWSIPMFNFSPPKFTSFNFNSTWNNFGWNNVNTIVGDTFTYSQKSSPLYQQLNYNLDYNCTPTTYIPTYTAPTFSSTSTSTTFTTSKLTESKPTGTKYKYGFLKDYDPMTGKRLARTALDNSVGWTGYCAKSVKTAIEEVGLGEYKSGHAYQMKDILKDNPNFKQITTTNVNVDELPAGCVLVYDRGAQGYSKDYGHVEITTGDGRGVSDGITNNLRKPSAIFIPV